MVERREYESYIKSRVEKLLRKSENNEVSSQRKREIEWLLLDQIRMFANSELSEEKFMDSILNEIKDVTYFNAEEDYYEDNITLIKQTIIKVYKNIIREHSNDPSKIWLDNQIAIILRSLKGISIDSQQTIAMFIRDIIKNFTIEYSNSPHKMETEKNDLLLMIEDIVNNSSFKTEKELEELIIMGISSKYMGIFTLKEIESIIESITMTYILPSSLPDLSPLNNYNSSSLNFEILFENYLNDSKTKEFINGILTRYSSSKKVEKVIDKITEMIIDNPAIAPKEIKNQLLNSDCGVLPSEATDVINIYMKYIDDLSKLDRDAFIKELIFSAMIKFIKGLRQNLQNMPSHSSLPQKTLEEKTYEIINEYYNNISVDKDASYKISISNTKRLIYKRFLNNRKRALSDTLLGIPTILLEEEKKEQLIRETVEKVFNNIIHITTKHPLEIIRYPEAGLVQVNGVFLPIDFLNELLSEQEEVLDRAMRNSCIFMNDYYNVHFDADYNKYLLPNDDIHVFGLTRDVKGYNKLIGYLKERVEKLPLGQVESLVEKPILSLFSPSEKQEVIDRYIESPSTKLNIELEKLMSANETTETGITRKSLETRIEDYDRAQTILNSLIIPQTEHDKIRMIAYFLLKKGAAKRVTLNDIQEVLLKNRYFFGHEYVDNFKNKAKQIREKVAFLLKDKIAIEMTEKKYDELFDLQRIMQYKHQLTALEIIQTTPISNPNDFSEIKEKFGSEIKPLKIEYIGDTTQIYDVDDKNNKIIIFTIKKVGTHYIISDGKNMIAEVPSNPPFECYSTDKKNYIVQIESYGTIKILKKDKKNMIYSFDIGEQITAPKEEKRKANLFGLVQTYISQNSKDLDAFLADPTRIKYSGLVNIVKVYDKLIYLNNFNFILDLENIYIMDFQSYIKGLSTIDADAEIGMICEITSLKEKAFVLYEQKINEVLRFVSIQGASESNIISASHSIVPNLTSFSNKNYRTLIGLEESNNMDDTFFSSHSKITKKTRTLDQMIEDLKSSKYILRYATAITDENPENIREKLINSKEIGINELIDRTIKGISNVLMWINNLTLEDAKKFFNIPIKKTIFEKLLKPNVDKQEAKLDVIKTLLYKQIQQNINELIEFLIKYKNEVTSATEIKQIDNWLTICSKFANSTITRTSDNKEIINKKISCGKIIELLTSNNPNKFIEFIVDTNECSDKEFEQIVKMVSLELPDYVIRILNSKLKSSTNKRIQELSKITNQLVTKNQKDDLSFERILGYQDERLSILRELDRKLKRYSIYYTNALSDQNITTYDKIKKQIELYRNQILIYEESVIILTAKEQEIQNTKFGLEPVLDQTTLLVTRNELIKRKIKIMESNLQKSKIVLDSLIEIKKFLETKPEYITEEQLSNIYKSTLEFNVIDNGIINEIIAKVETIKRTNCNKQNIIKLCDKTLAYLSCTTKITPIIQNLKGELIDKHTRNGMFTTYLSRGLEGGEYNLPSTVTTDAITKQIETEETGYTKYIFNEFYSMLYLTIRERLKCLPQQEQEEYLNVLLSEIQKMYMDYGEKYISYEELLLKIQLNYAKEICNNEMVVFKKELNKLISENSLTDIDVLTNFVSQQLAVITSKKEKVYNDVITTINQTCIKQLNQEQREEIRDRIDQQFDEMIIMKILIDSLITKVRNSAKPGLLNTTSKLAYIENIRRTNLMSKKYYEYLKTLPFTFTFLGKNIIFTNKKRINEYNDLIDISFRDLIMDLTTAYNSCEIFDPTSGTYGKPSISIKG